MKIKVINLNYTTRKTVGQNQNIKMKTNGHRTSYMTGYLETSNGSY